jgi:iron(III) transport system permease protein
MGKAVGALAWIAAILAVSPLLGIGSMLLFPPPDPYGLPTPGWSEVAKSRGLAGLIARSMALGLAVSASACLAGGWLAWTEARKSYPGRRILQPLGLLPLAMPSYVLAATLGDALGPAGWIGRPLGLPMLEGFLPAALAISLVTIPYAQLTIGAALRRLSAAEEEAAKLLGASPWESFKLAIWPRIRPAAAFSALIAFLYAISDFGAVATLDLPVLTWRLYEAVQTQDLAGASMLGAALVAAALPALALARLLAGGPMLQSVPNPRPPPHEPLEGMALAGTYAVHALVVGLGLALPLAQLAGWVAGGLSRGLEFASPWEPVWDSLRVAAAGAAITVAAAAAPAWAAARGREGGILSQLVYLASALPGVLLAFGLMALALTLSAPFGTYAALLSSGALLMAGYAARFLAEAFGPLRTGVGQLDRRHEESCAVLGAPAGKWFARIALPQLRPSLAAAYLVAFIAILKELPITLLLGGATGLNTMAFRIWDRYSEALWHDAGLASLLLVGCALAMTLLTLRWRRHA